MEVNEEVEVESLMGKKCLPLHFPVYCYLLKFNWIFKISECETPNDSDEEFMAPESDEEDLNEDDS